MFKTINQEEVNAIVWQTCDTFRGVVDSPEYKNYILVFLFLKYISDIWKDKQEEYAAKYNGDPERIRRALGRERFIVPDDSSFDYLYNHRKDRDIGQKINMALDKIEEANKGKLDGIFRNIDFNSENNLGETRGRNCRLKNLIDDFANDALGLRPSHTGNLDVIGNVYEYLIARFASDAGKKDGEFFTPSEVSALIARLMHPEPGQRIYDPACGSGSLLIKVAQETGSDNFSLYGQESNEGTWALCKMNMFVHRHDNAQIKWGDTLNNPRLLEDGKLAKFDIVVANPPFSFDNWGQEHADKDPYQRFWRGIPPKSTADYAFISHMIESTVENTGKVGVVVPHGVLFRGSAEEKIRQKFIEENLLEAVIGLPAKLFYGTIIPAAILVFNRGKTTTDVLFIDASNKYLEGKNQNKLGEEHIRRIIKTYDAFETVDKYSYRASFGEIKENEFNLNISRYVDTFEEEEDIDIPALQQEIEQLEKELEKVKGEMNKYLMKLTA
ncbi:MAG: type I restriction-modification system subunit M [Bacteroidota bacterium]